MVFVYNLHSLAARVPVLCDYDNWAATIVSLCRKMPIIISLFITATGYATGEPIFSTLGWTLSFVAAMMYPFKAYFLIGRADPYCPAIFTAAFPNDELIYIGIVITFAIGYSILWRSNRTWFQWLCLGIVFLGPSVVLVVFDNEWWVYLLISFVFGALVSTLLLWWLRTYEDIFVYLFCIWPIYSLYTDSILIHSPEARLRHETMRRILQERAIERNRYLDATTSMTSFAILGAPLTPAPTPPKAKKFRI